MTCIFNRSRDRDKCRKLRGRQAPAEALLWTHLRGRQQPALKFRRQYGVGTYGLDFYCPALKLAIDVDGNSHIGLEAEFRDQEWQRWLAELGIRFLRFVDMDGLRYTEAEVAQIVQTAKALGAEEPG